MKTDSRFVSARPLAFPDVRSFGDLFLDVSPTMPVIGGRGFDHADFCMDSSARNRRGSIKERVCTVPVEPFCAVRSKRYGHLYVCPTDTTLGYIARWFIGDACRERVNFSVVVRDDGAALVLASNSLILADCWLALVDAATVPESYDA